MRLIGRSAVKARWSALFREQDIAPPAGGVPLRQVARVHRGVVTGANHFFVLTHGRARELGVEEWCRPAITAAREILDAGGIVRDGPERKLLLDVPADIDRSAHPRLDAYLRRGERPLGDRPPVANGYIASRRRPWWNIGLSSAPPIVASYMARRAPAFALNPDGLAVVNIAHGIYPVQPLAADDLLRLVNALNAASDGFRGGGRTYHGGLEKFEPREMEALSIPDRLWLGE